MGGECTAWQDPGTEGLARSVACPGSVFAPDKTKHHHFPAIRVNQPILFHPIGFIEPFFLQPIPLGRGRGKNFNYERGGDLQKLPPPDLRAASMKGWKRSIGTGKIVVELRSDPTSSSV